MRAAPRQSLRVTNDGSRHSDSWLNRIALDARRPKLARQLATAPCASSLDKPYGEIADERRRFVLRRSLGRAEDLGARREHEMRVAARGAHRFEQVHRADAVRFDAADRIAERSGDARLPGKMEHRVRRGFGDQRAAGVPPSSGSSARNASAAMIGDAELAQAPEVGRASVGPMRADDRDAGARAAALRAAHHPGR